MVHFEVKYGMGCDNKGVPILIMEWTGDKKPGLGSKPVNTLGVYLVKDMTTCSFTNEHLGFNVTA